jgi:predicted O-linked N-acetylglucosamine transferase (SPINDLY family)
MTTHLIESLAKNNIRDCNLQQLDRLRLTMQRFNNRYDRYFFQSVDEINDYVDDLVKLLELVLSIDQDFVKSSYPQVYRNFLESIHFRQPVHSTVDLNYLSRLRSSIVSRDLERFRVPFHFDFPPRSSDPFRYGIVVKHLSKDPETRTLFGYLPSAEISGLEAYLFILDGAIDDWVLSKINHSAVKIVLLPKSLVDVVKTIRNVSLDYLFFLNDTSAKYSTTAKLVYFRLARKMGVNISTILPLASSFIDYMHAGDYYVDNANLREFEALVLGGYGPGYSFPTFWGNVDRSTLGKSSTDVHSIVFFTGASFLKLNGDVVRVWSAILGSLPGSRIRLSLFPPHYSRGIDSVSREIIRLFEHYGVDRSRVELLGSSGTHSEWMRELSGADIYLDSFPYSSLTSIHDAIKLGIPPVVLQGNFLRNLHAPAILSFLGAPQLVAKSESEYIEIAVKLARSLTIDSSLRQLLIERSVILENTQEFFNNFIKGVSDER